uniref:Fe2OG dioxygenase domain-containing protein n=2 Tax=Odontella aurita TaxID=265563 RepID=A0A7S4IN01_9STRA|mmetsp:Transcript_27634/g.81241  ORF Transcript_27634/g.81241 Transcript_27634/m.81241 type:complete len:371 (+) Transcript_27634:249-1361(+)
MTTRHFSRTFGQIISFIVLLIALCNGVNLQSIRPFSSQGQTILSSSPFVFRRYQTKPFSRQPSFILSNINIPSINDNDSNTDTIAKEPETSNALSQYWINDELFRKKFIVELQRSMGSKREDISSSTSPTVTTIHRNKAGNAIAVEVASAISSEEVATMRALSGGIKKCIEQGKEDSSSMDLDEIKSFEVHFEHRSFGEGKGGNDCTYLAPFLQAIAPGVAETVKGIATLAWRAASWNIDLENGENIPNDNHFNPMSMGIRTSEHLSYNGWRSLEAHKDVGSIYTIMISIKDPEDYEGGEFFLHNSMFESTNVKLDKFSAIVFKSNNIHGVRPITSGHRESFVTELWINDDSPIGMCRPTEEQWETFISS